MRVSDWRRQAFEGSDADYLRFVLFNWKMNPLPYEEWADVVEAAISSVMTEMASRKADLQDQSEDGLTATLAIGLTCMGLEARAARVNGNCDLTIQYMGQYLWIGEAKIFYGVANVWGGYLQLVSRYADGLPQHSRGGMLLYCYKENAAELLAEWKGALSTMVKNANCCTTHFPLTFASTDTSAASGLPLSVIHYAFPFFHHPLEKELKLTPEALEAGRVAKAASKAAAKQQASANPKSNR